MARMPFALRKGECGIQSQLAIYFKHPLGTSIRGFFDQYMLLENYYSGVKDPLQEDSHKQAQALEAIECSSGTVLRN